MFQEKPMSKEKLRFNIMNGLAENLEIAGVPHEDIQKIIGSFADRNYEETLEQLNGVREQRGNPEYSHRITYLGDIIKIARRHKSI